MLLGRSTPEMYVLLTIIRLLPFMLDCQVDIIMGSVCSSIFPVLMFSCSCKRARLDLTQGIWLRSVHDDAAGGALMSLQQGKKFVCLFEFILLCGAFVCKRLSD